MAKLKKEQQQVIALSAVLAVIGGVLVYFNWDKILPRPSGVEAVPSAGSRLSLPGEADKALFERADFRSLRAYGDVPIRALPGSGSPDPFVNETSR